MKVLFVCTGNTCRSPIAEAVLMHLSKFKNKSIQVSSRGLSVFYPQPVNAKAINALKSIGIDHFSHDAAQISDNDIAENDYILTMTSAHKLALKSAFPAYKDKIYTLCEKAYGKDSDVVDPFGGTQEIYDACAEQIYSAIDELICTL